jgi:hypothetical protein
MSAVKCHAGFTLFSNYCFIHTVDAEKSYLSIYITTAYVLGHYATSQKVVGLNPDGLIFFSLPNPSSCTMALGSTQLITEMSTRNIPGGKGGPASKSDNLTTICELIV